MRNLYSQFVRSLALPWVSALTDSEFWNVYRSFRKDSWTKLYCPPPEDVHGNLKALVRHAYDHVPFYQHRMKTHGLSPDLKNLDDFRKFPLTTKSDLAANFPDLITASQKSFRPWRYVSTSGTVERLTVVQDFRKRDFVRAAQLLALNSATGYEPGMRYMEIPPDICVNVCGALETLEPSVLRYLLENLSPRNLFDPETLSDLRGLIERQLVYRRIQLPSFSSEGLFQKQETLDRYLQKIDDYRPYVLKALPIYLYLLALHILERKVRPPRIMGGLMPMGSSMTRHMKRVVESAFGCQVREDYGCAELGAIAAECGEQNGLHTFGGLFFIEVVRKGVPVDEGEIGKVLITDLFNYAMPLIRYDVGDVALVQRDPCKCGLPGDRLEIQGRVHDCLVKADGTVLAPDTVIDSLLERPDTKGFQLEFHDRDRVFLQVVPKNGQEVRLEEIKRSLSSLLGASIRISARSVSAIVPEPGGKYRFVKNLSKEVERLF